jgi:hypothetical protein
VQNEERNGQKALLTGLPVVGFMIDIDVDVAIPVVVVAEVEKGRNKG